MNIVSANFCHISRCALGLESDQPVTVSCPDCTEDGDILDNFSWNKKQNKNNRYIT